MKKALLFVMITALCFSTLEPVSALIATEIAPTAMTAIRFIIGGLIMLPFSIVGLKKHQIKLTVKTCIPLLLLSIFLVCVSMVPLQYAVLAAKNAGESPAVVAIIFCCNSVFTMLFSALILKEKISVKSCIGILLCLVGIVVSSNITAGVGLVSGGLALLSAVTMGLYTVLSKRLMKDIPGVVQTGFSFLFGGCFLALVLLICGVPLLPTTGLSWWNGSILVYLGIVVTGIGYAAYFKAIEHGSATVASSAFLIKPVLAPFATLLIVGSAIHWTILIAVPLVVVGSVLMMKGKQAPTQSASK